MNEDKYKRDNLFNSSVPTSLTPEGSRFCAKIAGYVHVRTLRQLEKMFQQNSANNRQRKLILQHFYNSSRSKQFAKIQLLSFYVRKEFLQTMLDNLLLL